MLFFLTFYSSKNSKKKPIIVGAKTLKEQTVDNNKKYLLSTKSALE